MVIPIARTRMESMPRFKTIKKTKSMEQEDLEKEDQASDAKDEDGNFEEMLRDFMQKRVLYTFYEEEERSCASLDTADSEHPRSNPRSMTGSTPLRQLLESTPNRLERIEKTTARDNVFDTIAYMVKSIFFPVSGLTSDDARFNYFLSAIKLAWKQILTEKGNY